MKAKVYIGLSNFPKDKKNTIKLEQNNFERPSVSLKHNGHEKFTIAIAMLTHQNNCPLFGAGVENTNSKNTTAYIFAMIIKQSKNVRVLTVARL